MKSYKCIVTFQKKLSRLVIFIGAIVPIPISFFIVRDAIIHGYIYDPLFIVSLVSLAFVVSILFYKGWRFLVPTECIIFDDRIEARKGRKVISKVKFDLIKNVCINREGPSVGKIMAGSIFIDITGGKTEKYVLIETEHIDIYLTPVDPDGFVKDLKEAIRNYKGKEKQQYPVITEYEEYSASKRALFYFLFIKMPVGYFLLILPIYFLLLFSGFPLEIIVISIMAIVSIFEFLIYFHSEKIVSSMLRTVPLEVFLSKKRIPTSFKYDVSFPIEVAPYMSLTNAMATGLTPQKSKIIVSPNFFKHSINVQNAILRHEKAHIINKDILKLFLLSLTFNILLMLLVLIFPNTKVMDVTLFLWILFLWIVVKSIELRADITSVRNEVEANELVDALIKIGVEVKKASGEILDIINRGEERKPEILGDMSIKRPKSRLKRIIKWIRIHPPLYIRINETKNFKKYKSKTLLYFIPKILHLMLADIL